MMEFNVWDWSGNLILVSEKHSSSVDYHLLPLQVVFLHILAVFTWFFFLEKYGGRRVVEESGAALIYGSAFATQLVLPVLCF